MMRINMKYCSFDVTGEGATLLVGGVGGGGSYQGERRDNLESGANPERVTGVGILIWAALKAGELTVDTPPTKRVNLLMRHC